MSVWLEAHNRRIAELSAQLSIKLNEAKILNDRLVQLMAEGERRTLDEQGKQKFFRTTIDLELVVRYDRETFYNQFHELDQPRRTFPKGTLISNKTVYLDDDGDGYLDFPEDALEEVILVKDEVNWDFYVYEG